MQLYICLECGAQFTSEGKCPKCDSELTEPTTTCANCGETIGISQARFDLCPDCERAAENKLQMLIQNNFTPIEIEYLANQLGVVWGVERLE